MKKLIKGFSQYINECGCAGGNMLPEDGNVDMGLDTTGAGVKNQVDGSVLEDDENEGGEDSKQINISAKGETLSALLNKIKELCDSGTSFEITITPEGEDAEPDTLIWDGDGDDYIDSLEIEGEEESEFGGEDEDEFGENEDDNFEDEEGSEDDDTDDDFEEDEEGDEDSFNESKKYSKKQKEAFANLAKNAKGTKISTPEEKRKKEDELLAKKNADKKVNERKKLTKQEIARFSSIGKGKTTAKKDNKKKVNETFKAGKTVGGVKVPAMEGPKTGSKKK